MATPRSQRIGILIILIVTVIGTLGSFLVMILGTENQKNDQARNEAMYRKYKADSDEYEKKLKAQAAELSTQYYPTFSQYATAPAKFDLGSVTQLASEDLVVGDGETIDDKTKFATYYIGWNPDGAVFDQSIKDGALQTPIPVDGLANASLITGWKEGLKGMKIGGVRLLTIPSDKAYGESGSQDQGGKQKIGPNTPLKYIVMAIPAQKTIPQPEFPAALMQGMGQ